ncbi:MAG: zinc ribbon domain-containing protein [Candidatus Heimdallarchaeota archaeon]|nr:zinc ribbon domain-containing protein [Candidatus Heimdallarchaeota archaeon]
MKCEKCGNDNAKDARFCKQCGEGLELEIVKGQKTFVADSRRTEGSFLCFGEEDRSDSGGMALGVVFIGVAIIMTLAMIGFFEGFGNAIGSFFGDFGENMGQIGSDIGNFFGNWGENFGVSVRNFFGGVEWWKILEPIIVLSFLVIGVILLYKNYREQKK